MRSRVQDCIKCVCVFARKSVGECVYLCVSLWFLCVWVCERVYSPEKSRRLNVTAPFLTSRNDFTPIDVEHYFKHEHDGVWGWCWIIPRGIFLMFPWNTCHFVEGKSIYEMRDELLFWLHAGRFEWWVKREMKTSGDTLREERGNELGLNRKRIRRVIFP